MRTREVNFDGLVGSTHHYAGSSLGNGVSAKHRFQVSNPHLVAKQGLLKTRALADAGLSQAVISPHERPYIPVLRRLGFSGSDEQVLEKVSRQTPHWLSSASPVSPMWATDAATICLSADSLDRKVHLMITNLNNKSHRSSEAPTTRALLRAIFRSENSFVVYDALPQVTLFGDEGMVNYNRLGGGYSDPGIQLFAYSCEEDNISQLKCYSARQSREASEAVTRLSQANSRQRISTQQNPDVIDLGVFHSDMTAVSNRRVSFCHQQVFARQQALLGQLCSQVTGFTPLEVPTAEAPM